jgi:hypothetical protein
LLKQLAQTGDLLKQAIRSAENWGSSHNGLGFSTATIQLQRFSQGFIQDSGVEVQGISGIVRDEFSMRRALVQ